MACSPPYSAACATSVASNPSARPPGTFRKVIGLISRQRQGETWPRRRETARTRWRVASSQPEKEIALEDPVSEPSFIRWLRRRRGCALPSEARGYLVLVSDVAGSAGRSRA